MLEKMQNLSKYALNVCSIYTHMPHICCIYMYRVAQNKMSHQTQCTFSTTSGDFSIKIIVFYPDFPT